MENYTLPAPSGQRKNRTVIVYFGIFAEYLEIIEDEVFYLRIVVAAMLQATVEHKEECSCNEEYTYHRSRERTVKNFHGEYYEVPIWQIRCKECGAVFTILPSFLARYQRWDVDALSKILQTNLVMNSSYRHTLKVLEYAQGETIPWNPEGMLHVVHWLGSLQTLPCILTRLGLAPPPAIIEDEKFVRENKQETYVAFISHKEVIWWVDYLPSTDEIHLQESFQIYCEEVRKFHPDYKIEGVTYDGWKSAKVAFQAINSNVALQECHLHAKNRMTRALPLIKNEDPDITEEQLQKIKEQHDRILDAESRATYSQRLRRFREAFGHYREVARRCSSLKNKMLMFLAYLLFPFLDLSKFSTLLDQIIRYFDRKFLIMQTFRNSESANKTVRAFGIVHNFWRYMQGARREGLSPIEIAGADLHGIPWLEFVNLTSTSSMSPLQHVANLDDT